MNRCLISYEAIPEGYYSKAGLHRFSPRLKTLQLLPTTKTLLEESARRSDKMSIQGVQPKLSARLNVAREEFELVDTEGRYIIKPQNPSYAHLPENEDLTMRLAALFGIITPLHALVACSDGTLAYVIKRFDRKGRNTRVATEDFAQLAGLSRETKYDFSMERLAALIDQFTTFPILEKRRIFELTLFCFVTGNEDMHLKNFSVIRDGPKVTLSPAYDLLSSTLAIGKPGLEEIALPLNGKKRKLQRRDWLDYWPSRLGIADAAVQQTLQRLQGLIPRWNDLIVRSFLPLALQENYVGLLRHRLAVLGITYDA